MPGCRCLLVLLLIFNSLEPWHLLIAGGAQGSALALDWIARYLYSRCCPKGILVRAVSIDQAAFKGARVIAPS
ncbi:MAG: hypothetical protein CM1200mP39_19040 [Dehalococcoidia bacterium]|nr:MAG: hypothetical protein CM1200mP39_19040 [Dehalococcoidia bacterium]